MQSENIRKADNLSFIDPVIPPITEIIKKSQLREELENEVKKFLLDNEITELKIGETGCPDGKIPWVKNVKFRETSNEVIAKKNSEISKKKAQKKQKTIDDAKKTKKSPLKTVDDAKQAKNPSLKADRPKKQSTLSPESKAEVERKREIRKRRAMAEEQGLTEFLAPCKTHGMTKYSLRSNGTRCEQCIEDHRKKRIAKKNPQQMENLKRKTENRERLAKAVAENKEEFEAQCINCGLTTFKVKIVSNTNPPKHGAHCKHCITMSSKASDERRKQQRNEKRMKKN